MKIIDYLVFFALMGIAMLAASCSKDEIVKEFVYVTEEKIIEKVEFNSLSERYSDINETTSYFKNQEYFTGYLSKQFIIDQLNIFSDDHSQYWVFGKNIAILDFDDDGKQDIIAFGSSFCADHDYSTHNGIFIYVSDYINGGAIKSFFSDSYYGLELDVNDFNGDSVSDVMFFPDDTKMNSYNWNEDSGGNTNNPPNSPTLLYYDKTFNTLKSSKVGIAMDHHGASSGDLDNDGDIDFIQWPIPGRYSDEDTYLDPIVNYNQGSGIFTQQKLITDLEPDKWHASAYEIFDINNDGFLDLIAGWRVGVPKWEVHGDYIENTLPGPVLFYGNGTGTFTRSSSYILTESILSDKNIQAGLLGVSFTDYDLDGDIDILLTTTREEPDGLDSDEGLYYNNYHLVLLVNENGTFTDNSNLIQEQWSNDISNFYFIRTIDKNNDGRFDLVPDGFANWSSMQYGNDIHWLNINDTYLKIN